MGDYKGLRSIFRSEPRKKARDDRTEESHGDKGKRPMDVDGGGRMKMTPTRTPDTPTPIQIGLFAPYSGDASPPKLVGRGS